MAIKAPAIVRGDDGLPIGTVEHPEFVDADPGETVEVHLVDGRAMRVLAGMLTAQDDGSYRIALDAAEVAVDEAGDIVVPVVAEEVAIGKRTVETGKVRVKKTVRTIDRVVDEPVFREEFEVERVVLNRPIDAPVGPRQEGDTLVVPLLEEILVVEKRLILREEVRITRRRTESRSNQVVTLRSEEATVEREESTAANPPT